MTERFDGFEYSTKDVIGHGAFAIVYKGKYSDVSSTTRRRLYLFDRPINERANEMCLL